MTHIALHFIVPLLIAVVCYRTRWLNAFVIMIATLLVDLDHLLADPVYDPQRCSIGFHPLHTVPAIIVYAMLFGLPLLWRHKRAVRGWHPHARVIHLVGAGLMIHMALDWLDCLV